MEAEPFQEGRGKESLAQIGGFVGKLVGLGREQGGNAELVGEIQGLLSRQGGGLDSSAAVDIQH